MAIQMYLAQASHAGQLPQCCKASCHAARGAQARLETPTHQALALTAPSAIKLHHAAARHKVSQLWLCQELHGWCWPGGRGNAQPGPKDTCARPARAGVSRCLLGARASGDWPGLILPLSILSLSQSRWLQTTGLGGQVPQAHPRILTK